MLNAVFKVILIPALTFSAGFLFSISEKEPTRSTIPYPEHLVGAYTGGFGEETCRSCHFDYDLNWDEGSLSVNGLPSEVKEGYTYEFQITIKREDLGKAGFQFSARFSDGSQAGEFLVEDNPDLMLTKEVPDSLQYLQHSEQGALPEGEGENSWYITWKAPEPVSDTIHFHISANAANGDQSEFGDWIYQQSFKAMASK